MSNCIVFKKSISQDGCVRIFFLRNNLFLSVDFYTFK